MDGTQDNAGAGTFKSPAAPPPLPAGLAAPPPKLVLLKDLAATLQSTATVVAIIVGGIWSYRLFIMERKDYPHANIEQAISHVQLTPDLHLLRVGVEVTNTGSRRMDLKSATVRVQQVLPFTGCSDPNACASTEVAAARNEIDRRSDRFPWPTIGERVRTFAGVKEIEPTEKDFFDAEFVVPSNVSTIRVYSYVRNEHKPHLKSEIGWHKSDLYTFANAKGGVK